jgi:hypothetical protein
MAYFDGIDFKSFQDEWEAMDAARPSDAARGFKTAWQQIPQTAYGLMAGVGAAGETAFGEGGLSTGLKRYALGKYVQKGEEIATGARATDDATVAYEMARGGDFGALVDWVQYGLGYTAGQGLQALLSAGIGAVGGKLVLQKAAADVAKGMVAKEARRIVEAEAAKTGAKVAAERLVAPEVLKAATTNVASRIGQMAAVGAQAFGMEGGEIFGGAVEKAEAEGRNLTGDELAKAFGATVAAGTLEFVGDKLGLDAVFGRSKVFGPAKFATGFAGRAARAALGGAAIAPAEAATEYGQTLIEQWGQGRPLDATEAINAAALGGLGGGLVGGGAGLMTRAQQRTAAPPAQEIDVTPILGAKTVDEAVAGAAAVVAPPASPERAMGAALAPLMDRQASLMARAAAQPTALDRELLQAQAASELPDSVPPRADGYVDLRPLTRKQADARLLVLQDELSLAEQPTLDLTIVPHPAQSGRFAIARVPLPDLTLAEPTVEVGRAEAQQRIEGAALGLQERLRKRFDEGRQISAARVMQNIEQRGGVASPAEAEFLRVNNLGRPYDRVDPALAAPQTVDERLTEATGILLTPTPRSSEAQRAGPTEQQLVAEESRARSDSRIQRLRQEREARQPEIFAPNAVSVDWPTVESILRKTPALRNAQERIVLGRVERSLGPIQAAFVRRAILNPASLTADERIRWRALQNLETILDAQSDLQPAARVAAGATAPTGDQLAGGSRVVGSGSVEPAGMRRSAAAPGTGLGPAVAVAPADRGSDALIGATDDTREVAQQESVRQEPQDRAEGREAAQAGPGDRLQPDGTGQTQESLTQRYDALETLLRCLR